MFTQVATRFTYTGESLDIPSRGPSTTNQRRAALGPDKEKVALAHKSVALLKKAPKDMVAPLPLPSMLQQDQQAGETAGQGVDVNRQQGVRTRRFDSWRQVNVCVCVCVYLIMSQCYKGK